jgi:hypothetical protein
MPIWRFSLAFFALATIYASVIGSPSMNITVTVPDGSSNHGSSNLVCTPTTWYDVIIFFAANFFAHAATIKTLPGEKGREALFTIVLALLFPFSGISRGIEAIVRHASWPPADNLTVAARAGALCIAVRGPRWRPKPGEIVKVFDVNENELCSPEDDSGDGSDEHLQLQQRLRSMKEAPGWYKIFTSELRSKRTPKIDQDVVFSEYSWSGYTLNELADTRKLHGAGEDHFKGNYLFGYLYGILPSNTLVKLQDIDNSTVSAPQPNVDAEAGRSTREDNSDERRNIVISSSHNVPQVAVALVQVVYAGITLYRTRGDQLNRYGYAAFGLTVLPYIIMSIVNLLGNLATPTYPTLYAVDSYELQGYHINSISRLRKSSFIPVVGRILQDSEDGNSLLMWSFVEKGEDLILQPMSDSTRKFSSDSGNLIKTTTGDVVPSRTGSEDKEYKITPASLRKDFDIIDYELRTLERGEIRVPPYAPFLQSKESQRWSTKSIPYWLISGISMLGIVPYAVIGALTHFQPGESSVTQRVFTMYWLATGLLIGAVMPFYKIDVDGLLWLIGNITEGEIEKPLLLFLFLLLFSSAAIGGFVVVGQMVMEYGTCTSF